MADFVALDLEFSGLFLPVAPGEKDMPLSMDDYFRRCADSIPKFLPLQLGICCARHHPDAQQSSTGSEAGAAPSLAVGKWELRTHEFNLWPKDRGSVFSADLQSLRFLRMHGFDFNAYFECSHYYTRLPRLEDGSIPQKRPPTQNAAHLLAVLRASGVPLIVHNGLLDLLHLYDKFFGSLMPDRREFAKAWLSEFPFLFDTRHIAQEGRHQVLHHSGSLSLEALHKHLSGSFPSRMWMERGGPLGGGGNGPKAHGSSGHDALLTAEVFLMEIDLWLRSDAPISSEAQKRRRISSGEPPESSKAAAEEQDEDGWSTVGPGKKRRRKEAQRLAGLVSAQQLQTHEVCRQFHNR
eukprot:CAMPEP_0178444624 /NCGR_PEP_ID=MMETSP0689_2-20121128/39632_1 /TAXON_ID=160604 /ORGANISM="Amphidinium massartii, Strain CS-259" /LENGTH=350 /DNA_ID=CAMNT_0020068919 /DNA_START=157 /DNA_END=1206 /DNA_ORIENTATION=+